MNKNLIDEVLGAVKTIAGFLATMAYFTILLAIVFGVLFAPLFTCLFETGLATKYNVADYPSRWPLVHKELKTIRFVLFLVSIAAWVGLVVLLAININNPTLKFMMENY